VATKSGSKAFPPFLLDSVNQCLWRDDARISLAPKAFAVLDYLIEHAGRLVSQDELLQELWPETYVQPEVLRKYILDIRRALGDPPKKPRFVETLPKRGYRFIASIRQEPAVAGPGQPGEPPARLVGREAALSELNACLRAALRGQRQVVFVTGEAGIGKTSVVDVFLQQAAREAGIRVARGQSVEGFAGKEAYYPVLEAFGLFMQSVPGDELVQVLAAHAPTWLIQFPAMVKADQRGILRQEILGATRERMVREICEALEAFTAEQGLILILEDLHLADDSTLDLISALARRRSAARLMLLATYRPVEVILSRSPLRTLKQDLIIHHLCQELNLAPLTLSEVEEYISAEFPQSGLGGRLAGLIHRHSDGNPLFMVALLERLRQQGLIVRHDGCWALAIPPEQMDPGVPETLQQMLEVQLEQLGASGQRLLRTASVCGPRFSAWAAAAVLDADAAGVEESCEDLALRQQFIRRSGTQELADGSISAQYEFKHSLYRDVLYRQLPPHSLRQFHLRLASRMEALAVRPDPALAFEMAAHFEAGRDYERAVRYLILAAGNAAHRYAHADAIQLLRHAIDLLAHLAEGTRSELEIAILERISDVLYAQGEMEQSAEVDYRVAELAARGAFKVAQVNALTRLARALAFLDPERCIVVCERAVDASRTHDDPLLQARAEMLRACWRIVTNGWSREEAEKCAEALARIRSLSDELPAYYEILYAHVQFTQGDYEGACQTAWAGIPKSVENDNLVVYLSAHSSLAQALLYLGRWGDLLQVIATALDVTGRAGNTPWTGIFQAALGWLRFQAGDLAGARQIAESLCSTYTEEPAGQVQTMAMVTAGFVWLESGTHDRALEAFTKVCERQRHPRFFLDWYWRLVARLGLSRAALACGDLPRATAEADTVLEAAMSTADAALQALAWEGKAGVALAGGDCDAATACLNRGFTALQAFAVPFAAWRVHAAAVDVHRRMGNVEAAEHHREQAETMILQLAYSVPEREPLRKSILGAAGAWGLAGSPKRA
jgi:DNA-binding winged helix-turn-helix (wHTH) protein/tetratricopeptide (TPR) repeat protein